MSAEALERIRTYLGFRFPAMKDAPLVETQVCQYENTPDNHFILDRHPQAENVWIVGGGSGHGFKHGPVIGEMVAELVMEEKNTDPHVPAGEIREGEELSTFAESLQRYCSSL